MYADGFNSFIATAKDEIRNYETYIDQFEIPKKIICIYSPYMGG